MQAIVILTSVPDAHTGQTIAQQLVERNLVACAHLFPMGTSVYKWQNQLHVDCEMQLMLKTNTRQQDACIQYLQQVHPYDLPEVMVLPVSGGLPQYLEWLNTL